ncbi:MAG: DUF5666 domain-containing protein [Bryobacteraceae bacterium]
MTIAIAIFAATLLALPANAHDPSKHKGKPTEGEVASVSGDRLELKTASGVIAVSLTSKTKIEHGADTVDKSHLKAGERIHVFGTKLPSGELVAKEIVITPSGGHDSSKHESHSGKKNKQSK